MIDTVLPLSAARLHMQAIDVVRRVSPKIQASILMFTYFNPIMRRGAEQFCRDIKEAGASGQPPAVHSGTEKNPLSRSHSSTLQGSVVC